MIQDISPYRLDMAYRGTAPAPDDCFSLSAERMCFCRIWGTGAGASRPSGINSNFSLCAVFKMRLEVKNLILCI